MNIIFLQTKQHIRDLYREIIYSTLGTILNKVNIKYTIILLKTFSLTQMVLVFSLKISHVNVGDINIRSLYDPQVRKSNMNNE